ncbi:MAG TPA: energy-coupling factor transporter transmembrane protein EcfT [Candidatus Latescibacteria bacterium]|nr:energy-coupling factor transporter transmembrane protein EcfT [Candidatus Latescibacterota bacterium]
MDFTLGRYFPADSPVHRLDPRAKLLGSLLIMIGVLGARSLPAFGLLAIGLSATTALGRLPISLVLRGLRPFFWLFLLTFLLNAYFTPGSPGPLGTSLEGTSQGAVLTARLALMVLTASLLTLTTSPIDLTDGIERLLKPLRRVKVPAHEVAMMMVIALRFLPLLAEEADRIKKAQMARGVDFEGGILKRLKNIVPILVPLFLSAFRKADLLSLAMEARCYRGGEGRTSFSELRFGLGDGLALATSGLLALAGTIW